MGVCEQRQLHYDATIVTNGYNLTVNAAKMLLEHRVRSAQVTLDGAAPEHDRRRTLLGGQGTFERLVENMRGVLDATPLHVSVRVNVDSRNAGEIRSLLDELQKRGLARRRNFGVYFAPVEAITEGCHSIVSECMTKGEYGQLEAELARLAFDAGIASLPYPPRFRGLCGAIRPNGFVILPNGDVHKCWDTVSMPESKVGTIFASESLFTDERALRWSRWSPFDSPICTECKILPNCAGACAHKVLNPDQTLGEAASLPCPSWRYNIKERLVLTAERSKLIAAEDYDSYDIHTESREICPAAPPPELKPERRRLMRLPIFGESTLASRLSERHDVRQP